MTKNSIIETSGSWNRHSYFYRKIILLETSCV